MLRGNGVRYFVSIVTIAIEITVLLTWNASDVVTATSINAACNLT